MRAMSHDIYFRIFGYVVTIVMHVTNTIYMASLLKGDAMTDPEIRRYESVQARYFTCWTFVLQIVYAILGLSCDFLTLRNADKRDYTLPRRLRGARDALFAGIQWPSTFLVFTAFWGLYAIDRDLILPPNVDKVLTRTSNHVIHTLIVPVVVWEIVYQPRRPPRSHRRLLMHVVFHFVTYFSVVFYTYYEKGIWIYPVFARLAGSIYFPLFMLLVLSLLIAFYFMQWHVTKLVWGSFEKSKDKIN